jgi:hypothetical protein
MYIGHKLINTSAICLALLSSIAQATCGQPSSHSIEALKSHGRAPPAEGTPVTIEASVSGVFLGDQALNGFYLQDTTDAIFVYAPSLEAVRTPKAGERWRIKGQMGRYRGRAQLERITAVKYCGEAVVHLHTLDELNPAAYASLDEQPVKFTQTLYIADLYNLGRYGSMRLSVGGRAFQPNNGVAAGRRLELHLDDGSYRREPRPLPYVREDYSPRVGDAIEPLTGILTRAFGDWRIHPLEPVRFVSRNPRPQAPSRPADQTIRAVNFNLFNYFIDPGGRGAGSDEAFASQRERLRSVLLALDADVLGLHEIQNNPDAVADLLHLLNRDVEAAERYQAILMERSSAAIRSILLYRPARLSLEQVTRSQNAAHPRDPVAGVFETPDQQRFAVAIAHFKSRGGCPTAGDIDTGEGCWAQRREREARQMLQWLRTELAEPVNRLPTLVLADFNAYASERAMAAWQSAGFVDLFARHIAPLDRYTYIYRGQSGYLDHALATPSLARHIHEVHSWPINADEPAYLATEGSSVWRASDHDPIIVDWQFNH